MTKGRSFWIPIHPRSYPTGHVEAAKRCVRVCIFYCTLLSMRFILPVKRWLFFRIRMQASPLRLPAGHIESCMLRTGRSEWPESKRVCCYRPCPGCQMDLLAMDAMPNAEGGAKSCGYTLGLRKTCGLWASSPHLINSGSPKATIRILRVQPSGCTG